MEAEFDLREHECPSPSSHSPPLILDRSPRWRSREKLKKELCRCLFNFGSKALRDRGFLFREEELGV